MIPGMCRCIECGRWYFNWKKLYNHLVVKHGYSTPIPDEEETDGKAEGSDGEAEINSKAIQDEESSEVDSQVAVL